MHTAVVALALVVVAAQALLWLLLPRLQASRDADVRRTSRRPQLPRLLPDGPGRRPVARGR